MNKHRDGYCVFYNFREKRNWWCFQHSEKTNQLREAIDYESAMLILHLDGSDLKNRIVTLTLRDSFKHYAKYLASAQDSKNLIAVL